MRAVARDLDVLAGEIDGALTVLEGLAGPATWRGPGADRLRQGLRLERLRLHGSASELRSRARALRARATAMEQAAAAAAVAAPVSGGAPARAGRQVTAWLS